jgi:hypothetical protein
MVEFACTCGPVLGTPALAGEAPERKNAASKGNQQGLRKRPCGLPEALLSFRPPAEFNDICMTEGVCTRLSAPVENSTGWRRAM